MYLMIVFKALSGKTRIDMLKLLMMGEYHVSGIKASCNSGGNEDRG